MSALLILTVWKKQDNEYDKYYAEYFQANGEAEQMIREIMSKPQKRFLLNERFYLLDFRDITY